MPNAISQSLLPEFDMEMASTRRTLARVPDGRGDFRPHAKSMTLARLAGHLGELPAWALMTLGQDELDLAGGGSGATMTTRQAVLDRFDADLAKARAALAGISDGDMMTTWTLRSGDQVVLAMPRIAVFRGFVMNHMIHHRAQLGVYLRMNDVAVPSIYGPSADEGNS